MNSATGDNRRLSMVLPVVVGAALFAGCALTIDNREENSDLFESPAAMHEKIDRLSARMPLLQVFLLLGVPAEQWKFVTLPEDVQRLIYGKSEVQGNTEELEKWRKLLATYKIFELHYQDISRKGKAQLSSVEIANEGYDHKLLLVFKDGLLLRATVDGDATVDDAHADTYWKMLTNTLTGAARGAVPGL